jgi:hypothetical protein
LGTGLSLAFVPALSFYSFCGILLWGFILAEFAKELADTQHNGTTQDGPAGKSYRRKGKARARCLQDEDIPLRHAILERAAAHHASYLGDRQAMSDYRKEWQEYQHRRRVCSVVLWGFLPFAGFAGVSEFSPIAARSKPALAD